MSQTITLPDLWLLIAPCGCLDGWFRVALEGVVLRSTAEAAWKDFEPRKRDRERMVKQGFVVRGGDFAEWNDNPHDCQHDPKWGLPTNSGNQSL